MLDGGVKLVAAFRSEVALLRAALQSVRGFKGWKEVMCSVRSLFKGEVICSKVFDWLFGFYL